MRSSCYDRLRACTATATVTALMTTVLNRTMDADDEGEINQTSLCLSDPIPSSYLWHLLTILSPLLLALGLLVVALLLTLNLLDRLLLELGSRLALDLVVIVGAHVGLGLGRLRAGPGGLMVSVG